MGATDRHLGYPVHAQNGLPAFSPDFAVRCTMGNAHFGQLRGGSFWAVFAGAIFGAAAATIDTGAISRVA